MPICCACSHRMRKKGGAPMLLATLPKPPGNDADENKTVRINRVFFSCFQVELLWKDQTLAILLIDKAKGDTPIAFRAGCVIELNRIFIK